MASPLEDNGLGAHASTRGKHLTVENSFCRSLRLFNLKLLLQSSQCGDELHVMRQNEVNSYLTDCVHFRPSFCISFASLLRLSPCCVPLLHCWRGTSSTARGGRGSSRREKTTEQKVQDSRVSNLLKPCKPTYLVRYLLPFEWSEAWSNWQFQQNKGHSCAR